MKKSFSILLLFFITALTSTAYTPMCYKGHFYVNKYDAGLGQTGFLNLSIQCDTTINAKSYIKVWNCDANGNTISYQGAMREDSIAQKVYYLTAGSLQERLVFDFSLNVNDTFNYNYINWNKTLHVDSIVTKLLYGANRKVIYFDSLPPIIEGIGSMQWGLMDRPFATSGFTATTKIIDAYSITAQCLPTSLQTNNSKNNIAVYPTLVQNYLNIDISKPGLVGCNYTIINMAGQIMQNGTLPTFTNKLNLLQIPAGLYILQLQSNNTSYHFQFYKQ
jgi:hypothetical protein